LPALLLGSHFDTLRDFGADSARLADCIRRFDPALFSPRQETAHG
jgi:hypothetical protein